MASSFAEKSDNGQFACKITARQPAVKQQEGF
jgi:hypothetical protein